MRRNFVTRAVLLSLCALSFFTTAGVLAQQLPAQVEITAVDTSQFPQIQIYLKANTANGSRYIGLFADAIEFFEDGTARSPAVFDTPRGTSLTFLIDGDQIAENEWHAVREAIEGFANPAWMDEDLDVVTIIVANGIQSQTLVDETPFHNAVFNAFITSTGAYVEPEFVLATPLNDLVGAALAGMARPSPRPGMYRALVVFSSGGAGGSERSAEGIAGLANESDIPIFTVQLGQDASGQQLLEQLARNTGGQFVQLESPASLVPVWEIIKSHRDQYTISYRSQIVASGSHAVKVQVSEAVADALNFEITVLEPSVAINLPQANEKIERRPDGDGAVSEYKPKTQAIKYEWQFPDGHERQIGMVQLRVNGIVQQQLDLTTSSDRNLTWDISNLNPGPYSLRVEVVDELGLAGESPEIPVTIALFQPTTSTPAITPSITAGPGFLSTSAKNVSRYLGISCASGLSIGAIIAALFVFRRRAGAMGSSPSALVRRLPMIRNIDNKLWQAQRHIGPLGRHRPDIKLPQIKKEPKDWLEVVEGNTDVRSPIALDGEITVGRSAQDAKIVFAERTVSRLHARIVSEHGDQFRIFNNSGQGTWVNEQRVPDHGLLLRDGDVIRLGQARLRFRSTRR